MSSDVLKLAWMKAKDARELRERAASAEAYRRTGRPDLVEGKLREIEVELSRQTPDGLRFEMQHNAASSMEDGIKGLSVRVLEGQSCLCLVSINVGEVGYCQMTAYPPEGDDRKPLAEEPMLFEFLSPLSAAVFIGKALEAYV